MNLGDLIKKYRNENNVSMEDFAARANLSKGYISMLEKNTNPKTGQAIAPSLNTIKQVALALGLEFETVLAMIDQDVNLEGYEDLFSIPNIEPPPKTYKVPRVGTIACGAPITAIQNIDTYDDVPDYIHCDFTLLCKGDSMIDARINDGDVVYIKQQSDVDSGEIAAVLIDNEATLKRVYKKTNRIILRAANIKYDDLEYEDEQLNEIRILGRVVGFTSVNVR